MQLYLVQHGKAHSKDVDPDRSLTAHGRLETERVAALAARLDLDVQQIRHSGKTRAQQTATILSQALSPPDGVVARSGLAPMDHVRPVAKALAGESASVMLVGHLPFMARLAGVLLTGDPEQTVVKFHNSAIVCLVSDSNDDWRVAWILTPEMAGA